MTTADAVTLVASVFTIAAGIAVTFRYLSQKRAERKSPLIFLTIAATAAILLGAIWFTRPLTSKALNTGKTAPTATSRSNLTTGSGTKTPEPTVTVTAIATATPERPPTAPPPQPTATPTPTPPRIYVSDTVMLARCDPANPGRVPGIGLKNIGGGVLHWVANTNSPTYTVTPSTGILASGEYLVGGLTIGNIQGPGAVTISDPSASNSPVTIDITCAS